MVYSPKLTFVANENNMTDIEFTLGETICFGSLEFTTDCFSNLSLSPKGNGSSVVFVGMVHNNSPSLHKVLEESSDEGDTTSGGGGALDYLALEGCNVVTPTVPITTTPPPENTLALLTTPTVPLWTAALQPGTGLLLEQQQTYQEKQQAQIHAWHVDTEHKAAQR
jgi:hypothetical protein